MFFPLLFSIMAKTVWFIRLACVISHSTYCPLTFDTKRKVALLSAKSKEKRKICSYRWLWRCGQSGLEQCPILFISQHSLSQHCSGCQMESSFLIFWSQNRPNCKTDIFISQNKIKTKWELNSQYTNSLVQAMAWIKIQWANQRVWACV